MTRDLRLPVAIMVAIATLIGLVPTPECAAMTARFVRSNAVLPSYFDGSLPPSWGDVDGDGDQDIPLALNTGAGTFVEMPGMRDLLAGGSYHGSAWCDYDRNGLLDVVILPYPTDSTTFALLLQNQGGGLMVDRAPALGMNVVGHGETPLWADFDADGWPDLFAPYYSHVTPFRSFLYRNNGDGTFADIAEEAGVSLTAIPIWARPEGASAADWNQDGAIDIYCASRLFVNDGTGHFFDVRPLVGLPEVFDEGATFVDYDNDGDLDLYVRAVPGPTLFRNDQGFFTDVSASVGMPPALFLWGDCWADFNHDGALDLLFMVWNGPAQLMVNQGGGTFVADSAFALLGLMADAGVVADSDLDGDLDIMAGIEPKSLYLNRLQEEPGYAGSSLRVRVVDDMGHETQHGASVRLWRTDGGGGGVQTRVIGAGATYIGQSEYNAHFGVDPQGTYAMSVSFPSAPGSPVVVDASDHPLLGSLVPGQLVTPMMRIHRDGTVHVDTAGALAVPSRPNPRGRLHRPAPNPARTGGVVHFELSEDSSIELAAWDLAGRRVRRFARGAYPAGLHSVRWSGGDDRGRPLPAGVYLVRLEVDGRTAGTRRWVLLE